MRRFAVGISPLFLRRGTKSVGAFAACALLLACLWSECLSTSRAAAGTLVLNNRTTQAITVNIADRPVNLPPGDVRAVRIAASSTARFTGSLRPSYQVEPDAVYYLGSAANQRIDLVRIGLGGDAATSSIFDSDLVLPPAATPAIGQSSSYLTIPVKLLVDDDEAATPAVWQTRLRDRLAEASKIFERHCLVNFKVVAVETWKTDNDTIDFERTFAEFERLVKPAPARLAIGFTSQYRIMRERTHLGGTRGPLNSHMLIREWSNRINEPERLEVLVHELGHFLGAVRSPEPTSVMRAILGDRRARVNTFRIGFDPVNTLAMNFVAQSFPSGRVGRFVDLPLTTQLELRKLYSEIDVANPHDKTAGQYVQLLDRMGIGPLAQATRLVVLGVGMAAARNAHVATADPAAVSQHALGPVEGDEMFDLYVRTAAGVARHLANPQANRGLLIGLGVALDRTRSLEQHRLVGPLVSNLESPSERNARLRQLGVPTVLGKHELARHFALAAALTAVLGPAEAERACLALQLGRASHPGMFNASLYRADLAGIVFAHRLLSNDLSLAEVARDFRAADWLPELVAAGTDEHAVELRQLLGSTLSASEFVAQFGGTNDPRFRKLRRQLGKTLR